MRLRPAQLTFDYTSGTLIPALTGTDTWVLTSVGPDDILDRSAGDSLYAVTGHDHSADYIGLSEKGAANGVATLDGASKIPTSQLPALAITETYVAADQTAQLAIAAQEGDVVVRTDQNKSYIHNGGAAGTMADYQELLTPTDAVTSVNGYTGIVSLGKSDVGLANVDNTSDAAKPVSTAQQTALDLKADLAGATFSGAVSATNLSGTNTGDQTITLTGDITGTGTASFATTISVGTVTLAKMADLDANSILGNNTGSAATPLALTGTQVTALLDTFGTTTKGLVPSPGSTSGKVLKDDGTWSQLTAAFSDRFVGDGTTTEFTMSSTVADPATILVTVNGLRQDPTADYSVSGTTLTITPAPDTGRVIIAERTGAVANMGGIAPRGFRAELNAPITANNNLEWTHSVDEAGIHDNATNPDRVTFSEDGYFSCATYAADTTNLTDSLQLRLYHRDSGDNLISSTITEMESSGGDYMTVSWSGKVQTGEYIETASFSGGTRTFDTGYWTGYFIPASGGGSGATVLDDLDDVDTTTAAPTDGQALVYNDASSKWLPGTVAGFGAGSGVGATFAAEGGVMTSPGEGTYRDLHSYSTVSNNGFTYTAGNGAIDVPRDGYYLLEGFYDRGGGYDVMFDIVVDYGADNNWTRVSGGNAYGGQGGTENTASAVALIHLSAGDRILFRAAAYQDNVCRVSVTELITPRATQYHVADQKPSGTSGGAAVVGWNTRPLNTELKTGIPGASLASNQITLPAGEYRVSATAPVYQVDRHQLRLRDITNSVTLVSGLSRYNASGDTSSGVADLEGQFTLTASTTIELQHYCAEAKTGNGLGVEVISGEPETYAELLITKGIDLIPETFGLDNLADVDTATAPPTDGQVLAYDESSGKWYPWTPPLDPGVSVLAGDFTLENAGTASIADGSEGVVMTVPSSAVNIRFARYNTGLPPAPWDARMSAYSLGPSHANLHDCTLLLRNSANSKIISFSYSNYNWYIQRWTNYTTYSNAIGTSSQKAGPHLGWRRITFDGTTLTFYMSSNGADWVQVATEDITTHLGTVDQIGFGAINGNTTGITAGVLFDSFSVN